MGSLSPARHTIITNPEGERPGPVKPPPDPAKPSLMQRPCQYLASFVKALPVIFISGIICWSYYAFIFCVVLTAMQGSAAEQVICAVLFHLVAILFVWSYYMVVFTPAGAVPAGWRLSNQAVDLLAAAQSEEEWKRSLATLADQLGCQVRQRSVQNAVRYCEKCRAIKPDRAHHCSVCEDCTLKMDHHCPWVNNCVGFHNYKFFLLFLFYALCYCGLIAGCTARHFLRVWLQQGEADSEFGNCKYQILFVFFISILFCLSISSLFWYHVWLVLHNRSTLEQFRAPMFEDCVTDPAGWSLGKLNNLREVFGQSALMWPLPINTGLGDGVTFPTRNQVEPSQYQSLGQCGAAHLSSPSRTLINPVLGSSVVRCDEQGGAVAVATLSEVRVQAQSP